jgi:glycosyltransferase involved in cell wall biosynthesis
MGNPEGTPPLISVIIPTKNRREILIRNLERLHECTYKNLEVIVVDDGSTDGTQAALAKLLPAPKVVRRETSAGPGLARHAVMAMARGEFLFLLDDDSYVEPGAFEKMVEVFAEDPDAAAVTLRITSVANALVYTRHLTLPYCKLIWGGGTGIRAEVVKEVGGFTSITDFHGEEFDYAVRLTDQGYKIRYAPEIQAFDEGVGHSLRFPPDRLINVRNWILIFFSLFPFYTAALFSWRAVVSYGIRSGRERSYIPLIKGLLQATRRLPNTIRHRRLVSPATVEFYSDPNLLPETFNIPVSRKVRDEVRKFWQRAWGPRSLPNAPPRRNSNDTN